MATETVHTPLTSKVLDMNQKCLAESANISLHIREEMDDTLEQRTEVVEDENSLCSAETTDAEVEELSSAASSVGQQPVGDDDDRMYSDVVTPPLPEGCKPLGHQVAGHVHGKGKTKTGLLQDCDGTILKPIQTLSRGKRERSFYFSVTKADLNTSPVLCRLRPFLPHFFGTYVDPRNPDLVYLKIDDVTKYFQKPCIMDIKVGLKSYEDGAPPEKIRSAMLKYPYLPSVGFQILGMRVFHPATGEYEYKDKYYGRALDQSRVIEGLAHFLNVGENFRVDVLAALLDKLEQIKNWFEGQQKYQFYSSSLLLLYEGALNTTTVNGASGDGAITCSASNAEKKSVVSYSSLALNDSESILLASRDLKDSSNNVLSSTADVMNQDDNSNGYVTRLPSYKESVEVTRLVQNGAMNGEVTYDCTCRDLKPSKECKCRKLSQGKSNQRGACNGRSQGGGDNKGVTIGQMREIQRRLQQPYNSLSGGSSYQSASSLRAQEPVMGNVPQSVNGGDCGKKRQLADVKMIDFTHVVDVECTDENYLVGLRNLIQQFRTLLECHSK